MLHPKVVEFAVGIFNLPGLYTIPWVKPLGPSECNVMVTNVDMLSDVTEALVKNGYTVDQRDDFFPIELRVSKSADS